MKFTTHTITAIALRIGLAFVFAYAAIGSLAQPNLWIGFLPSFIANNSAASTLLVLFSIGELVLVVWLLSGQFIHFAALLAAVMLVGIVLAQPGAFSTTFRDIGLALMAIALFMHESPWVKRLIETKQ